MCHTDGLDFPPRALKRNEKKNSPRSASSRCSAVQAPPRPPRSRPDRRQTARSREGKDGLSLNQNPVESRGPEPGAERSGQRRMCEMRVPGAQDTCHSGGARRISLRAAETSGTYSRTCTQRGVDAPLVDRERGRRRLFSICRACHESVVYGQTCMESRWSAGRHGRSGFVRVDAYSGCGPAFSSSRDANHPPPAAPSR